MAQTVLSDATALIYLAQIPEGLSILEGLFGQVTITSIVKEEVLPQKSAAGEREIAGAIDSGVIAVIDDQWSEPTFSWLDEGEALRVMARRGRGAAGTAGAVKGWISSGAIARRNEVRRPLAYGRGSDGITMTGCVAQASSF